MSASRTSNCSPLVNSTFVIIYIYIFVCHLTCIGNIILQNLLGAITSHIDKLRVIATSLIQRVILLYFSFLHCGLSYVISSVYFFIRTILFLIDIMFPSLPSFLLSCFPLNILVNLKRSSRPDSPLVDNRQEHVDTVHRDVPVTDSIAVTSQGREESYTSQPQSLVWDSYLEPTYIDYTQEDLLFGYIYQ